MKKTILLLLGLAMVSLVHAQNAYFQQEVNYTIQTTLDDNQHILNSNIEIEYTNNSQNELSFIYFHLWPNAYKNVNTAFAKQKLEDKSTSFYYADESDRGYIDSLDFKSDNKKLSWQLDKQNPDIAIISLNTPLEPGQTITITTPFRVKVPKSYSRLGHVGQSYQMTQWYPKPAVYDANGWHPMPYLDMGEFYSEFGSFDVSITLPKNYVVGATGTLTDDSKSEYDFLNQRIKETETKIEDQSIDKKQDFPASADEMKTIRYTADNIHDFAWFADKRFYVVKGDVALESGKKVDTWVMFTYKEADLWKDAIEYVNRSVAYYSKRIGEYPYPHATAIQSALSAGAGMEYPMITVIGISGDARSLDQVITHEVGHNWFYGILGSNERDDPWMDEGLNSYYEDGYMMEYYGAGTTLETVGLGGGLLNFIAGKDNPIANELGYLGYLYQKRRGAHVPVNSHSTELTQINYGTNAYIYTAYLLRYLENYLGLEAYDKAMQTYFSTWTFKHPQPADFEAVFEKSTGKDLDWFFKDLLTSNQKLDYRLASTKKSGEKVNLTIQNRGSINGPVLIQGITDEKIIFEQWVEGFENTTTIAVDNCEEYVIDSKSIIPEINKQNNRIKSSGALPTMEKVQLKLLSSIEHPNRSMLYMMPLLSYNNYDGFMAGLSFHNLGFPAKKVEYVIAPMYGFKSGDVTGLASLALNVVPEKGGIIKRIKLGVDGRTFNFREISNEEDIVQLRFSKITPYLEFYLKTKPRDNTQQKIRLENIVLQQQAGQYNNTGEYVGTVNNYRYIPRATWGLLNNRVINPYFLKAQVTGESYEDNFGNAESYARLTLEANYSLTYPRKPKKSFDIRVFGGGFLANSDRDFGAFPLTLTGNNRTDFYYDHFYVGRNRQEGIWSQQVHLGDDGNFKTPFLQTSGGGGITNTFLFAVNLKADMPMKLPLNLPIKPYLDFGYFDESAPAASNDSGIFINGGIMLDIGNGIFGIYMPFIANETLQFTPFYTNRNFWERITFSIDLTKINPTKLSKIDLL